MPVVTQENRGWDYYAEVSPVANPTPEEFDRGTRMVEGLKNLRAALLIEGDDFLDIKWSSFNGSRVIVFPSFPVQREVVRADGFYEYTSPHEITVSDTPLVIVQFALDKADLSLPEAARINALGPSYHTRRSGFRIQEEYAGLVLDPHTVAVRAN